MMPSNLTDGRSEQPRLPFRQTATRYEPARRDVCLAWWEKLAGNRAPVDGIDPAMGDSPRHFALLLDISHTGASVALDEIPDDDADIWLRLEGEDSAEWLEAMVVGMTITRRGPHLVRLEFRVPCAFETLRAVVCG
jgi:hypothetical protein